MGAVGYRPKGDSLRGRILICKFFKVLVRCFFLLCRFVENLLCFFDGHREPFVETFCFPSVYTAGIGYPFVVSQGVTPFLRVGSCPGLR